MPSAPTEAGHNQVVVFVAVSAQHCVPLGQGVCGQVPPLELPLLLPLELPLLLPLEPPLLLPLEPPLPPDSKPASSGLGTLGSLQATPSTSDNNNKSRLALFIVRNSSLKWTR